MRIVTAGACVVVATACMGGCAILGFVANNVFPEKIKAAYRLPDRPTVIVVDDPLALLDDRAFLVQVAHGVGVELTQQRAVSQVIASERLVKLSARLGDEFGRMPIDHIGRELGAEQVVHVNIESVAVSHARMQLLCQVKVIDAVRGVRLFPASVLGPGGPTLRGAGRISVEIAHTAVADVRRGERVMVGRDLGRRVSVEVARLFVDYEVPMGDGRLDSTRS